MPLLAGSTTPPLPPLLTATAAFGDAFPGVCSGTRVALFESGGLQECLVQRVSATYLVVGGVRYRRSDGFVLPRNWDGTLNWAPMSIKRAGLPYGPAYIVLWGSQHDSIQARRALSRQLRELVRELDARVERLVGNPSLRDHALHLVGDSDLPEALLLLDKLRQAVGELPPGH